MSKLDNVIKELNKKLKNDIITMDKDAITFNSKDSVHFLSPSLEDMFHGEDLKLIHYGPLEVNLVLQKQVYHYLLQVNFKNIIKRSGKIE